MTSWFGAASPDDAPIGGIRGKPGFLEAVFDCVGPHLTAPRRLGRGGVSREEVEALGVRVG